MVDYYESEIKVLDIDAACVSKKLEEMGAKKVFDGKRTRTTFDNSAGDLLGKGKELRITEEGKIKLSLDETSANGQKSSIKVFISRTQEMTDLLERLGLIPISRIEHHRVSYELGDTDFDIDMFPSIPPFLEIDTEHYEGALEGLLKQLGLEGNEISRGSTKNVYEKYGLDYIEFGKI